MWTNLPVEKLKSGGIWVAVKDGITGQVTAMVSDFEQANKLKGPRDTVHCVDIQQGWFGRVKIEITDGRMA